MIIESHYIFLPKEKAKKRTTAREDETIVLNLHRSVGEYISKTFTLSSTVYDKSIFKRAYDTTIPSIKELCSKNSTILSVIGRF